MDERLRQRELGALNSGPTAIASLIKERIRSGHKISRDLADLLCLIGYEPMVLHIGGPVKPSRFHLSFHHPNIASHRSSTTPQGVLEAKWHKVQDYVDVILFSHLVARRFGRTRPFTVVILLDCVYQLAMSGVVDDQFRIVNDPEGELGRPLLTIQAFLRRALVAGQNQQHGEFNNHLNEMARFAILQPSRFWRHLRGTINHNAAMTFLNVARSPQISTLRPYRFGLSHLTSAIDQASRVVGMEYLLRAVANKLAYYHLGIGDGKL